MIPIMLATILSWGSPPASCSAAALRFFDSYINGPGTGDHSDGIRFLPPTQTSIDLAPQKPVELCVIAWIFPVAVESSGADLGPECQPGDFTVDGQAWIGM